MDGNGNAGRKRGPSRRASTKSVKSLGRRARVSVRKNDEATEKFIADVRAGRATGGRLLGIVEGAEGGGRFSVKVDGAVHKLPLRGLLKGRGGFHRNPEATTAARRGSTVLIQHGEIISVLAPDQVLRANRAMASSSSSSSAKAPRRRSSSNMGFNWDRAGNIAGASSRKALVASLASTAKAPKRNHRPTAPAKGAEARSWFSFF
jgi:hypothetical protein